MSDLAKKECSPYIRLSWGKVRLAIRTHKIAGALARGANRQVVS
jgi:pterin-4a-carbinolamine dehydratase